MNEPERQPVRLTREQLYEKVWQTPVVKLAEAFGVSDVAIHKVCEKHAVPKPPRGYWAQLAFGKELERPPLGPVADPELNDVVIGRLWPTLFYPFTDTTTSPDWASRMMSPLPLIFLGFQ